MRNAYHTITIVRAPFNTISSIRYVLMAYEENKPVGCVAIKEYGSGTMEVKRMYVSPGSRNRRVGSLVPNALERWALVSGAIPLGLKSTRITRAGAHAGGG